MNTHQLQKDHEDVYQHFFATQQIVLSTPFVINRAWDISPNYCWVNIKQKIPLRMYIGLKPCATKGFFAEKITFYDTFRERFDTIKISTYCPQRKPLFDECQRFAEQTMRQDVWYEISILSELPQDFWLWFDQILCLLLASWITKVCGWYSTDLPIELKNKWYTYRANIFSWEEWELLKLVSELESILAWYKLHTWVVLSTYFDWSQPFVTYHVINKEGVSEYHINRLDELIPEFDEAALRRLQYWVIYSWKPLYLRDTFWFKNHNAWYFEEVKTLVQTMFWDVDHSSIPAFMTHCSVNQCTEISSYMAAYASTSLELLYTFWICRRSYVEEKTKQFVYAINKIRYASNVLRKPSSYLSTLIDAIYAHLPKPKLVWFNYNDSSIVWGSLVFAMNWDNNYRYLTKAIEKVHETQHEAEIIYYNMHDGFEDSWLRIDQDLSGWLVHQSIQSWDFCIIWNDWTRIYWNYDELKTHPDIDLLLDSVTMKLRVKWEKPSSKQIHSQAACVDLLTHIIQEWGKASNKMMWKNSYTKSINEMRWKVIYPLIEYIRQVTGKTLNLDASWAMNEFVVSLWNSDLKVGIIVRVENL